MGTCLMNWPILNKPKLENKRNDKEYYETISKMLKWKRTDNLNNGAGYLYGAYIADYNNYKLFCLFNPHGMIANISFIKTSYADGERVWPAVSFLDTINNLLESMKWIDSQEGAEYSVKIIGKVK